MPVETALLPLEEIAARAERLVALSPADQTHVLWSEGTRASVIESARVRRLDSGRPSTVRIRVRTCGRTGVARAESGEVGELQQALRAALADARCQPPSPDWDLASTAGETPGLGGLHDPEIAALEPPAAQAYLRGLVARNATLRLRWSERRLVIASTFHPTRAVALTTISLEARTGRRPGSGFAAATARSLRALDAPALLDRARSLEAESVDQALPAGSLPLLLGPEAAAVLIDAFARNVLSGASRIRRQTAAGPGPWPISEALTLVDDPLHPIGAPLPFDLDGAPKRRRIFVEKGRSRGSAFDLELAGVAGERPTGHGLGGDDAWPTHLEVTPGPEAESELRRRTAGGLRLGALEELAIEPEGALGIRATVRSVRRIEADGSLGVALPPMIWTTALGAALASVVATGREIVAWMPRDSDLGAVRAVALCLAPIGSLAARRG